jgi:hypothetical protein
MFVNKYISAVYHLHGSHGVCLRCINVNSSIHMDKDGVKRQLLPLLSLEDILEMGSPAKYVAKYVAKSPAKPTTTVRHVDL